MTDDEMVLWIDRASYEDLLRKWRFARPGDPFFLGDVGKHFEAVMARRRSEVLEEHVRASKAIGRER